MIGSRCGDSSSGGRVCTNVYVVNPPGTRMPVCKAFGTSLQMLLALGCLLLFVRRSGAVSRCVDHACSPPIGNLATGRMLRTLHQSLCSHSAVKPHSCQEDTHPPALMADDPFSHPDTWWASRGDTAMQEAQEEIRLDLETQFCLSHVVLVFKSPRPAAMAIERSTDFGKTWEALKVFAKNCSTDFGLPDDFDQPGSLCTSRYSTPQPCTGGEVILRTLDPTTSETLDPYSPETLALLTITNLRIKLLKAQMCPASLNPPSEWTNSPVSALAPKPKPPPSAPYAIYTVLARGTCLCHGHAESCAPYNSRQDRPEDSNAVFGRCLCAHHTGGDHCEKCDPLYNDSPWRPANGSSGEPNPCRKCECHGHAGSCHFSQHAWISSGRTSGGVCNNCQHNTAGRRCHRCRRGYHRHPSFPLKSPHACTRCWCDPRGSLPPPLGEDGPWCHPRTGQCRCKPGIGGTSCSQCLPGYWGFGEDGCKPCTCQHSCNPTTGHCQDRYINNQVLNIPIGGKIPDMDHVLTAEDNGQWSKELAVSALHYTGKCRCKEKKLRSVSDLCKSNLDYVIKASVLSAHDKGSHAEVLVKVRKVLRSGQELSSGTTSIYPVSWTSRGCTCPVLNPGMEYLLAGPEEPRTGRLLVTMESLVVLWTPRLAPFVSEALRNRCP